MRTVSVRVRLLIIAAVVALSVWAVYPPAEKISLGLDLKGGVQLVLRVRTDDALRAQTQLAAEQCGIRLRAPAPARTGRGDGPSSFIVAGAAETPAFRDSSLGLESLFERTADGSTHTFRLRPQVLRELRRETVQQTIETIERRVNELGLNEPIVAPYTNEDQILVQLPGVDDIDGAKRIIRATAQLRLTLVEGGPFPSREAALQAYGNGLPSAMEILPGRAEGSDGTVYYAVSQGSRRRRAPICAACSRRSTNSIGRRSRSRCGRRRHGGSASSRRSNINRVIATVIDDRVVSVATIISRIDDRGQIIGLTREEMIEQVITLKSGALPAGIEYLDQHTVSATLGEDSIRAGVLASVAGLALVTAVHADLLQGHGRERVRVDRPQPPDCRGADGLDSTPS